MIQSKNVKQDKKEEEEEKEKRTIRYDISSKALLYLVVCLGIVFFTSIVLV